MDATDVKYITSAHSPSQIGRRRHVDEAGKKVRLQVAHTLTACCRCRQRKTRCDANLPRCSPCERTDAVCDYFDSTKGRKMPRSYVIHLQEKVRELEAELESLSSQPPLPLDFESLVRGAGLVKIRENDELRFLGPSSGIAMTRLVMELAKELCNVKNVRDIVPASMAQNIKERLANESIKPTSKVYPLTSSVAAPTLPLQDLTNQLVEIFIAKAQIYYPVLHEPSLRKLVNDVYQGSTDDYKNFMLRIVIALSMHKLDTKFAGLADSYYLAALPFLENAIRPMNLGTLQCFALIAEYSMTTPTRTAAYWVVGLATKLLQDLGMTDEATIGLSKNGQPLDAIETDIRRRVFWVTATMELGLAHSLGRPSAFAFSHDHPDVNPFLAVDDQYITTQGVVPGCPVSLTKQVAIHFMKMRYLQLEIRRILYLRKRKTPTSDSDPWFVQMIGKIHDWMANYPGHNDGNDIGEKWFKIRYHTMIIFLCRPSPQIPHPSVHAARLCFDAARFNIHFQKEQIDSKSADTTWVFTQQLFMAINTALWAMSYAEIREDYPKPEIERDLNLALEALWWASKRWPGVESALELYTTLVQACLKAYDGDSRASYGVGSPLHHANTASPQNLDTPPPLSTPSTVHSSLAAVNHTSPNNSQASPILGPTDAILSVPQDPAIRSPVSSCAGTIDIPGHTTAQATNVPRYDIGSLLQVGEFDPDSLRNPLPPPLDYGYGHTSAETMLSYPAHDRGFFVGSMGDSYVHHLQYVQAEPMDGLSLEEHGELMNNLELYGLSGRPRESSPRFGG